MMRWTNGSLMARFLLAVCATSGVAQTASTTAGGDISLQSPAQLQQRMDALSVAVTSAHERLAESQRQMLQLQREIRQLQEQMAHAPSPMATSNEPSSSSISASTETAISIEERQQALEAAVRMHEQTKVESVSKYPVRLTGLILFNGFLNKGVPDNTDLPSVAQQQTNASGNGSLGASFRQTVLGVEADGPKVLGALTSASVNLDFFSTVAYSSYGTSAGAVRLRTASIDLTWPNDRVEVGMVAPLISPLSPTSYATVAEPALAGAGNLWTWAPQLRYAHQTKVGDGNHLQVELGLWDSAAAGYNGNQFFRTASPAELTQQPAYESRLSYYRRGETNLQVGIGGYYSRQAYPGYLANGATAHLDSWASTFDLRIPLGKRFDISGEGYRGRALGGLGGGVYKDIIVGTNPTTGSNAMRGLNAIGGWTQFKTHLTPTLETNLSMGQDTGFAGDFHAVTLSPTASAIQLRARNRMAIANLVFRPKSFIILSPEYRRIWTWPIVGRANTVDVFTLAVGYQF